MPNVEVYMHPMCPYCTRAVHILEQDGVEFEKIDLSLQPERFTEMMERAQRRSVPQIFIDDHHVGGCDDLVEARQNGHLAVLLSSEKPAAAV